MIVLTQALARYSMSIRQEMIYLACLSFVSDNTVNSIRELQIHPATWPLRIIYTLSMSLPFQAQWLLIVASSYHPLTNDLRPSCMSLSSIA